ncbi:hypothetical protein LP418_03820 [Nocardioides sp. B-3]|nr:hypothetical protein [Nocardioides sp. B-3]UUZ60107.1 hypothetical protein LP418_03820 [Nocardioides sp. B-3]
MEHPQSCGDLGCLRYIGVAPGCVERAGAVRLVREQEAVDLGRVHPRREVRVGRGIGSAVRHRPGHPLVDGAYGAHRLLGVLGGAEGGDREEVARARQPAPHVAAVAGVVGDRLHRGRVHGLEQDRADTADEHGRVAVDADDLGVAVEPARSGRAVDALAVLGPFRPGHAREQLPAKSRPQGCHASTLRGLAGWEP